MLNEPTMFEEYNFRLGFGQELDLSINNDNVEPLKMIPNSNVRTKIPNIKLIILLYK